MGGRVAHAAPSWCSRTADHADVSRGVSQIRHILRLRSCYTLPIESRKNHRMAAVSVFLIGFFAGCLTGYLVRQRQRYRETSAASD